MPSFRSPDRGAIALGVMTYVGLAGWLTVLPLVLLVANMIAGGAPLDLMDSSPLLAAIVGGTVFAIAGYITGRASDRHMRHRRRPALERMTVLAMSRRKQLTLLGIAPAPYLYFAMSYRP